MSSLGTETVLNMQTLRKHYDALGSFLHVQTIKSVKSGKVVDQKKLRKRCEEIKEYLNRVLSSPVFNITLGVSFSIDCMECSKKIRKRMPDDKESIEVECPNCDASFRLARSKEGQAVWKPH